MAIDPKIEERLRDLLDHALHCRLDDVARGMLDAGEQVYREAIAMCVQASAYITIDVSKRWPVEVDFREISQMASESRTNLPITENEIYQYLSQVVFGFKRLDEVFADEKQVGSVPLFATANLLLSFTPKGQHWSDYLDTIWNSIEAAEKAGFAILPALMYQHRAASAHTGKSIRPSTS